MKKLLLALIMAVQTFNLWGIAPSDPSYKVRALEQPCPPSEHFRVFNGKIIKYSDAEIVGGEDGTKASQPISNEILQAAQSYYSRIPMMVTVTKPPLREEFPDEASYEKAMNDMAWNLREERRQETTKALVTYIKAYNEAWATAHPSN